MPEAPFVSLGVIILAAGASSRMGQSKMLLPWGNTSVLGALLAQWREVGAHQIAVVCAAGDVGVSTELDRLAFSAANQIVNSHPGRGMFSSIQCAAQWAGWERDLTHHAIVLGDQPHLRTATLRELMDFAARNPESICQPAWRGKRRHPVVFPQKIFEAVGCSEAPTLREFLEGGLFGKELVEIDDPGLDLDIDYPGDYERAVSLKNQ